MSRRSFMKWLIGSLVAFFGLGSSTYYYAREIEPTLLDITKSTLPSTRIPTSFNNFRIVQFSDTHIGFHYTTKQLDDLITKINALKPDLIVFTGDLIDDPSSFQAKDKLIASLSQLNSAYGNFWVYGNHDHGGYGTDRVQNIMDEAGFILLQNNYHLISKDHDHIIIAGIDDAILGRPDLGTTLLNADDNLFTILLAHEPDFADITKNFPVDAQLSGHSHGGQVRFPFLGQLYTPALAKKYIQGKYLLKKGELFLYVTKGIGTTRLPIRFLCRPELVLLTLKSLK